MIRAVKRRGERVATFKMIDEVHGRVEGTVTANFAVTSFVEATSQATGMAPRTVREAVARGDALGDDAEKIAGTSPHKGVEIDALIELPQERRSELVGASGRRERERAIICADLWRRLPPPAVARNASCFTA